jgi:hypothetical protein
MKMFDVSLAMALILLCSCGILRQLMVAYGDRLDDGKIKMMLFSWMIFVLVVIGIVSSGVSISVLP